MQRAGVAPSSVVNTMSVGAFREWPALPVQGIRVGIGAATLTNPTRLPTWCPKGPPSRSWLEPRKALQWGDFTVVATIHPSAVLRAAEPADRERLRLSLVEDLIAARRLIGESPRG